MHAMQVVVVPHTHWDREWYLPLEGYRYRLAQLMERLLELLRCETLPCFVLDGQAAAVEDWLSLHPERRAELSELVRSGRLAVGPWFVLADELLVSGEALIRNLSEGRRITQALGDCSNIAYSPDPFGHISQLPQITAGFGLTRILFARGIGATPTATAYRWRGADGTLALTGLLATSYSNGRLLTHDDVPGERILHEVARLRPHLSAPVALICAGSDHEFPDPRLGTAVADAADRQPTWAVQLGTFTDYFAALEAALDTGHAAPGGQAPAGGTLQELDGELRGARLLPLLPGVLSAHMPLKQANERCQDLLEGAAEPLAALAWALGGKDPRPTLRDAWRELLLNHAHDSICGCSIDAVHRENAVRFARVQQMAQAVLDEATAFLGSLLPPAAPGERRIVLNPLPHGRTAMIELEVHESLPAQPGRTPRPRRWCVRGGDGHERRAQVLSMVVGQGIFPYPSAQPLRTTRLLVECPLPALGLDMLQVHPVARLGAAAPPQPSGLATPDQAHADATTRCIANQHICVRASRDGTLTLEHRASGQTWEGLGLLESAGDAGDTYNFSPTPAGSTVLGFARPPRIRVSAAGPLIATLTLTGAMRLPAALAADRKARSRRRVTCAVQIAASVHAGDPSLHLEVSVDNQARDHRLRLRFPLRGTPQASWAESAFDLVQRQVAPPEGSGWIEDPTTTHPQKGVCFVPETPDASQGLAILARGLPEYEVVTGTAAEPSYVALTLLRCVGWLSREDIPSRRCQAGPKIATPDAQCQGQHGFRLALVPMAAPHAITAGALLAHSRSAAVPPICVDPAPPIPWGQESWPRPQGAAGLLEPGQDLIHLSGPGIVLSALQPLAADAMLLRFYNVGDTDTTAVLRLHGALQERWHACLADFEGHPSESPQAAGADGAWRWAARPRGILNVRLDRIART